MPLPAAFLDICPKQTSMPPVQIESRRATLAGVTTMTTILVIAAIVVVLVALGHIQFRA